MAGKTYNDLRRDSEAFSRSLAAMGMLGQHVAVIGPTSYEWIVAYFGTVNSGGVVVPIDVLLPAEEVADLLERADVKVLVYDRARKDVAEAVAANSGIRRVSMQTEEAEGGALSMHCMLAVNEGPYTTEIDVDRMCAILFTSGTTGRSKGVMLSHRNLADNATCLDMGIAPGTVSMTLLPIHHAYCFTMDILKGIYLGLTICINDSIMRVAQNMKLFKPEIVLLVPMIIESVYAKLRDTPGMLPKKLVAKAAFGGSLKTVCSGGAYLNPDMIDAFAEYGISVLQGYGLTECSPVISTNFGTEVRKESVGKLLPGCEAKIVDEEIWVRSPSVMLGYYKMPEETAEALTEDGWLRTGDLGYVDDDGYVYITGRKKNLIILSSGENVSPEEMENAISKDPLVKEILVSESGGLIRAEIFPDTEYAAKKRVRDIPAALQELVDRYNQGRPVYKRVQKLVVRETEFAKTPSRKIKRNQQGG